jgi:di/tricarboxylate transporter
VDEVAATGHYHFSTVGWMRDGSGQCRPLGNTRLREGDVLWVHATPEDMIVFHHESGLELHPVERYGLEATRFRAAREDVSEQLVQTVVAPGSDIIDRSLQDVDFRKRYGAIVVGLWRQGGLLCQEMASIKLQPGDVLVLQGSHESLARVSNDPAFLMMLPFHGEVRLRRKARLAGAIMLATIATATLNILSLEVIMLAGAAAMVLCGCITPRQAYQSIDPKIYVFIAGAIPLGAAMQHTGTAMLLAEWLRQAVGAWNPVVILLLIFAIAAIATQFMSDAATTAVFAPVAAALAQVLGQTPEPYVVTVAMASVTAFLTPIGHHGNLLVYGPGNYRFTDFTKVGTPLTALIAIIVVVVSLALWS